MTTDGNGNGSASLPAAATRPARALAAFSREPLPVAAQPWDSDRLERRLTELAKEHVQQRFNVETPAAGEEDMAAEAATALAGLLDEDEDFLGDTVSAEERNDLMCDLVKVAERVEQSGKPPESLVEQEAAKTGRLLAYSWLQHLSRMIRRHPELELSMATLLPENADEDLGRLFERSLQALPVTNAQAKEILSSLAEELLAEEQAFLPGRIVMRRTAVSSAHASVAAEPSELAAAPLAFGYAAPVQANRSVLSTPEMQPPRRPLAVLGPWLAAALVVVGAGLLVFRDTRKPQKQSSGSAPAHSGGNGMSTPAALDAMRAMAPSRMSALAVMKREPPRAGLAELYLAGTPEASELERHFRGLWRAQRQPPDNAVASPPAPALLAAIMSLDADEARGQAWEALIAKTVKFVRQRATRLYAQPPDESRYRRLLYYDWLLSRQLPTGYNRQARASRTVKTSSWLVSSYLLSASSEKRRSAYGVLCLAQNTLAALVKDSERARQAKRRMQNLGKSLGGAAGFVRCRELLEPSQRQPAYEVLLKRVAKQL